MSASFRHDVARRGMQADSAAHQHLPAVHLETSQGGQGTQGLEMGFGIFNTV